MNKLNKQIESNKEFDYDEAFATLSDDYVDNLNFDSDSFYAQKCYRFFVDNEKNSISTYKFGNLFIDNFTIDKCVQELRTHYTVHHVDQTLYFYDKDTNFICVFTSASSGYTTGNLFYLVGYDTSKVIEIMNKHADNSKKVDIKWITDAQGNYYNITEIFKDKFTDSLYPYIKGGVKQYVEDFLKSSSSILILIGSPGLGKTSFLRYVISHMNKKAFVTYNQDVFKSDNTFGEFVSSMNSGAFIIEDADILLQARENGNEIMSKLLNVGDGVIRLNGKKLIFSTNLPSTNDIDPAIMRVGRCYDVLHFRKLTMDEANDVCDDFNLEYVTENKDYTLAEIFNRKVIKTGRKVGFV